MLTSVSLTNVPKSQTQSNFHSHLGEHCHIEESTAYRFSVCMCMTNKIQTKGAPAPQLSHWSKSLKGTFNTCSIPCGGFLLILTSELWLASCNHDVIGEKCCERMQPTTFVLYILPTLKLSKTSTTGTSKIRQLYNNHFIYFIRNHLILHYSHKP